MSGNTRHGLIGLTAAVLLFLAASAFGHTEPVLVVRNLDSGATEEIALPDGTFVLGYTHSVLLTPAEEYYAVAEDGSLWLQKTVYESFGVGLPFLQERDSDFVIDDGKFILYLDRRFDEIPMVISPIPDHWVGVGENRIFLSGLVPEDGARIVIRVETRHVLRLGKLFEKVL